MAEDEVAALKETLCNQLMIMKRLYAELEEERQASASGADEALTMILRLQKEKAEEKMEAYQFKQMAEAKLQHADESLAMLEQTIFQKDVEIASLKNQVQAFRHILLGAGPNNADIMKLDGRWFSRTFLKRANSCIQVRRQTSVPLTRFSRLFSDTALNECDGPSTPALQLLWRDIGDNQNQCGFDKLMVKETDSDIQQVQDVSISVEKLWHSQNGELKAGSSSISENNHLQNHMTTSPHNSSVESASCSRHSAGTDVLSNSSLESESVGKTIQYVSDQCMLELPKGDDACLVQKPSKKKLHEPHMEAERMVGIPESMSEESTSYSLGSDDYQKVTGEKSTMRKVTSVNFLPNLIESRSRALSIQSDMEQVKCQIQQLADDIRVLKQEESRKNCKQLELLRKIHEQLQPGHSRTRNSKSSRSPQQEEALLLSLTEAMLSFSI